MTPGVDLERRLSGWLDEQAPGHAPDRVLAIALERVGVTDQRRSLGRRAGWAWSGLTRRQRLTLVLAATLGLLLGGLVIGSWLIDQLPRPPDLVVVHADGTVPEPVGVTVLRQRPDGSTEVLASWSAETLGASYADGAGVAVSPDGHLAIPVSTPAGASEYRIVDLRDPRAPPRTPDAESMFGAWSGDDRFAMIVNAGGYVAYDAHTGVSTAANVPNVGPREINFRPIWDAAGTGVHANGGELVGASFGVITLDGTFVGGAVPEFPAGVGARRTAPDGARIQCSFAEDFGCEDAAAIQRNDDAGSTDLFVDDRPDVRIADFATTVDGTGLWLLFETVPAGPRTLTLVHRAADGTEQVVGTFDAEADDPDEGSYFPGGTIAAMAPDDSRLVLAFAGPGGSFGPRLAVDLLSGATAPVDGAPAGWLSRTTLTAPRPTVQAIVETDAAIRGEWVMALPARVTAIPEGFHELTIRRTSGSLDAGFGQRVVLAVAADGPDGLAVRQDAAAIGCPAGSTGRYRWSVDVGGLRLKAIDDDCVARRLLLEADFERVLPAGDTGSVSVDGGSTVIASRFAVPFRLPVPADGLVAGSHSVDTVSISRTGDGGFVTIVPAVATAADPCDRFSAGPPLDPGLDAAVAYVEGLGAVGATVERLPDTTVGDQRGPTFRLTAPATCDRGLALFSRNGRAFTVGDGSTVTLVEPRPGHILAIIVAADPSADPAWTDALLRSIEFLD